mgnify:CR=1 FL=1
MKTTTLTIKEEIHELVNEISDEKLLNAVHTLLKPYRQDYIFSEEDIQELDNRMNDRKNGIAKSYTLEEAETYFKNKK